MAFAYFVGIIFFLIIIIALFKSGEGCGGDCNQGRTKCDCKKYF